MVASIYILTVSATIAVPVALAIMLRRRARAPWRYFFVGLVTFLGAQVVHLPLNNLLEAIGLLPETIGPGPDLLRTALVLGLTAGITEELARALGYALVKPARDNRAAIMMGLGHGGIEAMLLGGVLVAASISSILYLQGIDVIPEGLSAAQLALFERQMSQALGSAWVPFVPLVERLLALVAHVIFSLIVLQAFVRRNGLFLLLAILYHATVNFVAVLASVSGWNLWLVEGALAASILPGALLVWRLLSNREGDIQPAAKRVTGGTALSASLRKELRYQWRTRRVLIVVAVFMVMGMGSPLLAKYTPQILGSIEEAQPFADLIPEPSVNDAVQQYISNLTQFGFILVILLGMGAVAGEKERGTAAMMLSKPLPRWSFLVAKFLSQATVYFLAMLLASVGGYYYTLVLFGDFSVGPFALSNALLLVWLLVYAAATLMGSAAGKTTGAGAGIAAVVSIMLLLVGAIPRYGALAPGGLVAWAGQAPLDPGGPINGGALAMGGVLILLFVLAAVAILEEQEI